METSFTFPLSTLATKFEYWGSSSFVVWLPLDAIFHKKTASAIIMTQNKIVRTVEFTGYLTLGILSCEHSDATCGPSSRALPQRREDYETAPLRRSIHILPIL